MVHDVLASYNSYDGAAGVLPAYGGTGGCGIAAVWTFNCNNRQSKTGWALDAGVKVNLPSFGAGDNFLVTAPTRRTPYGTRAFRAAMWGEGGQVNGNGQPMFLYDTAWNPLTNQWSTPTAWSVSALLEHHFTPAFYIDLEGSYGHVHWSNAGGGCNFYFAGCGVAQAIQGGISPNANTLARRRRHRLDAGHQPELRPRVDVSEHGSGQAEWSSLGTVYNIGGVGGAVFSPNWEGNSSGFAGRFRITRYF